MDIKPMNATAIGRLKEENDRLTADLERCKAERDALKEAAGNLLEKLRIGHDPENEWDKLLKLVGKPTSK